MSIPDATLNVWEDNAVQDPDSVRDVRICTLIAAYRESRAENERERGASLDAMRADRNHWRRRAEKAEADLAALRAGIEALASNDPRDRLRSLLSTSTDRAVCTCDPGPEGQHQLDRCSADKEA